MLRVDEIRTTKYLPKKKLLRIMGKRQTPITNDQKLMIIKSYADGITPSTISRLIGKSVGSIKMFYSRWKLNSTLPPKVMTNRSKINGRMGLLIKKQVSDTPKLGLKKLAAKIKEKLPEDT